MIVEFIGNSGSGKTTIIQNFIKHNNSTCFFCDDWWYSKKKLMYLMIIPYLFNPKLIKLLIISGIVLRRNKINGLNKFKQIRHLAFHFAIGKIAKKKSKKGLVVFLSESFITLIPNMFLNNQEKQQDRFLKLIDDILKKDLYIYIHNDFYKLLMFKSLRDGEKDMNKEKMALENQTKNLNIFIDTINIENKLQHFHYDYTEKSLDDSLSFIKSIIFGETP